MARSKKPKVDYDDLFNNFVTHYFQDFLAFAIPKLHAMVDWQKPPKFWQKNLINTFRDNYKARSECPHTDKLVRVSLLGEEASPVYIHIAFQHQPEANFAERMFDCMGYIMIKYNTPQIGAVAILTGDPPPVSELVYELKTFSTECRYEFPSIIAAHQDEAALIASQNVFALAVLAAKYAYEAREDVERLFVLKRKVLELSLKWGMDKDVPLKPFIFIKEFMLLPEEKERLLEQQLEALISGAA